jgi:hypothetical protein
MDEVRLPNEGKESIVETVGALMLGASEAVAAIASGPKETERAEEQMVVEINDSPVDENQVDTVPVSQPSSPANTVAITVMVGGVQAKSFGAR